MDTHTHPAPPPNTHTQTRSAPGAGKCGNLGKGAIPPAVKYELEGKLKGHAEAVSVTAASRSRHTDKTGKSDKSSGGSCCKEDADEEMGGGGAGVGGAELGVLSAAPRSGAELWARVRLHSASGEQRALGIWLRIVVPAAAAAAAAAATPCTPCGRQEGVS
jgi:hypothetical protein